MRVPKSSLYNFFHQSSKDIFRSKIRVPLDSEEWPESWKNREYKTYENSFKIKLDQRLLMDSDANLLDIILSRKSSLDFGEKKHKITIKEISYLINYSLAFKDLNKKYLGRVHPSGGARYPLEYYFLVQRSDELALGIYHYNIKEHLLEQISTFENIDQEVGKISSYPWVRDASLVLFMTSIFDRSTRKYTERGYRLIFLEAGHVMQNIYLLCTSFGLSIRALAGTYDLKIENLLGIDGEEESLVYSAAIG